MQRIVIRFWYALFALFIVLMTVAPLTALLRTVADEVQQRVEQLPQLPEMAESVDIPLAPLPDSEPVLASTLMRPTIASGATHTCVVTRSEQVICWGGNETGQLGNGSDPAALPFTNAPTLVSGLVGAQSVALGESHSCALLARSGQVWCWGSNEFDQLGSRARGPMTNMTTAKSVEAVDGVTQLVSGANHLCVLRASNQVWCWGDNQLGQLAIGDVQSANLAVRVAGLPSDVVMLAAGATHTCALTATGEVWCWGDNQAGQIDDSGDRVVFEPRLRDQIPVASQIQSTNTQTCALVDGGMVWCWGAYRGLVELTLGRPVQRLRGSNQDQICARLDTQQLVCWNDLRTLQPVVVTGSADIATGYQFDCVLLEAAQVLCRGNNQRGQVAADGALSESVDYLLVPLGARAHSLSAGDAHVCALWQQGAIRCWGRNFEGQLGDASVSGLRDVPTPTTPQIDGVIDVVAAGNHTCVIRYDRSVACWGDNQSGQLGIGDFLPRSTPQAIWSITNVQQLTAGSAHTCALQTTGEVWCWGDNTQGQLGFQGGNQALPYRLTDIGAVVSIASGGNTNCALRYNATVVCWGAPLRGNDAPFAEVSGLVDVVDVALGLNHACALQSNGAVVCWGDERYGQLGGVGALQTIPELPAIRALIPGARHTCAIDQNNGLWCWGWNVAGQVSSELANTIVSVPQFVMDGVAAVAAGFETTCARLQIGETLCWGDGSYGQLGNGGYQPNSDQPYVANLADGFAIASGGNFSCALLKYVLVRCWGGNDYGQLGNGTTTAVSVPQTVRSNDEAVAIAAGNAHACLLVTDGTVRCWGHNNYGQLGNETTENSSTPVVTAVQSVVGLTLGQSHSCALLQDGGGACWGRNDDGQLGSGNTASSGMPLRVAELTSAIEIAAGGNHTCALQQDTTVWCWGRNDQGQLATGEPSPGISVPTIVSGLSSVKHIALGNNHSCALSYQGTVWCWGWNQFGQVGMGQVGAEAFVTRPQQITDVSDVVSVSAGGNHTCVLQRSGAVKCWGDNYNGQLGMGAVQGAAGVRTASATVVGLDHAVAISAGGAHTCALLRRGDVACWGWNRFGQLGNGVGVAANDVMHPAPVVGLTQAVSVGVGNNHLCAVDAVGTVWCWGDNAFGQLGIGSIGSSVEFSVPNEVDAAVNSLAVDLGSDHTCALLVTTELNCWGRNEFGQVGNSFAGNLADTVIPNFVGGLIGVSNFALGGDTSCAVVSGAVYCWGDNQYAQIGYETVGIGDYRTVPTQVPGVEDAQKVVVGLQHVCALRTSSTVLCWGRNNLHQISESDVELLITPMPVPGVDDVIDISAGSYHTCATTRAGRVMCWGGNQNGQLGVVGTDIRTPQQVIDVEGGVAVSAGHLHTCALLQSRQVRCWGDNAHGQLGSENGETNTALPARDVPDLQGVLQLESGGNQTCTLLESQQVWCWGENANLQLGVVPNPDRATPAMVISLWDMRASVVSSIAPTPFPALAIPTASVTPTTAPSQVPTRTLIRAQFPTPQMP